MSPEREIKPLSRQASVEELDCKLLGEEKGYKDVSQTERTQASLRLDVTWRLNHSDVAPQKKNLTRQLSGKR